MLLTRLARVGVGRLVLWKLCAVCRLNSVGRAFLGVNGFQLLILYLKLALVGPNVFGLKGKGIHLFAWADSLTHFLICGLWFYWLCEPLRDKLEFLVGLPTLVIWAYSFGRKQHLASWNFGGIQLAVLRGILPPEPLRNCEGLTSFDGVSMGGVEGFAY
ncbi:hypothetical protein U1Q18_003328, partial [Sarracenia purpurea var. burkii]